MWLKDLLENVRVEERIGPSNPEVQEVQFDSRKVRKGDLFVAVRGTQVDGHRYIPAVIESGAAIVVCESLPEELLATVTYVRVDDTAAALGHIAQNFYGRPSEKMILVGVTGTNGKTTTATVLYKLLSQLGYSAGLLSTIRNYAGDSIVPSSHTTGDALQIASLMGRMVAAGCTHCFMEVTSHAVHQQRVAGLHFDGAIFTNLSHDHLDYHGTMEAYRDVKKSFFSSLAATAFALTNLDDPVGAIMVKGSAARVFSYGSDAHSDFPFSVVHASPYGLELNIAGLPVQSPFLGVFNAYNLTAAFAAAVLIGLPPEAVAQGLGDIQPVEGRMERVGGPNGTTAVVDFAHTPDALLKALRTIREFTTSDTVWCVLGCGGDRDKEKRPAMAAVAAELSDHLILTTDNPRSEDPAVILAQMREGIPDAASEKVVIVRDRREAIQAACRTAPAGAVVLIAGKGHEKFQEVGAVKIPFDDVQEARAAFEMATSASKPS